jgi:multiple sugar transport system permease protein
VSGVRERLRRLGPAGRGGLAAGLVGLLLLLGVAAVRPLIGVCTRAAAQRVVEERAGGILAAVKRMRAGAAAEVRILRGEQEEAPAPVRQRLTAAGWEVMVPRYPALPPPDPLPEGFTAALLETAGREGSAADLDLSGPTPRLVAAVRSAASPPLLLAVREATAELGRALTSDAAVGGALYVDGRRRLVSADPFGNLAPSELEAELAADVLGEDRPRALFFGPRGEILAALAPLKDFEGWDTLALVLVTAPRALSEDPARSAGGPALIPGLLLLALLVAGRVGGAVAARAAGRRSRRLALLPAVTALLLAGGALLFRGALQAGVRAVLSSGPGSVRELLARGGLVERYTFGMEMAALGALLLALAALALVRTLARYLDRPRTLGTLLTAWSFLAPAVAGLLLFFVGPMLFAAYISLHDWSIVEPVKPFVGLANYTELLADADFRHALGTSVLFTLHVPVSMALALALALLLNRPLRGVGIFRTLFFLPSITSFVAIAMVWQWIYNPDFGLANWVLRLFGLPTSGWLTDPATALPALMLMAVWIGVGYQMVIYLAGLQGIPQSIHEAALMDGAGPVRRFFRITLPLLKPTTFFVLVTSIIGSFQVFTQVYIMTEGGPVRATDVVVYHIYSAAWDEFRMGAASAMSWVLFALLLAFTVIQFRLSGREAGVY